MAALADWQAVETTKTYAVAGRTAAELYRSIGERGPKTGSLGRAIAHTTFTLTWTRKYEPRGAACVLATARPKLTIIYTLPKPAEKLTGATAANWQAFIAGVRDHEKVHGGFIVEMVRAIEATSLGLTVDDDPGCRKIRVELTQRLAKLSDAQRLKSRQFDQVELSDGGAVHRLILDFVNGG